jgi:hypothetical protein
MPQLDLPDKNTHCKYSIQRLRPTVFNYLLQKINVIDLRDILMKKVVEIIALNHRFCPN